MICFDLKKKFPFFMKKGTLEAAAKKQIFFEITYADAFEDHDVKKVVFSNCIHLINMLNGNNMVFNSGTNETFLMRTPFDVSSLYIFYYFKCFEI